MKALFGAIRRADRAGFHSEHHPLPQGRVVRARTTGDGQEARLRLQRRFQSGELEVIVDAKTLRSGQVVGGEVLRLIAL